jgi:hypothetical protein
MAMEEGYLMLMHYVWSTGHENNRNDFFERKKQKYWMERSLCAGWLDVSDWMKNKGMTAK